MSIIRETNLAAGTPKRGKVRDIYDLGGHLLLVASDRISAFDVVMPGGIPFKGRVLNGLSAFWFAKTGQIIKNHLVSTDADEIIALYPILSGDKEALVGRSTLCTKTEPILIECVVRGYLAGSAYKEYLDNGTVAGVKLPAGMKRSDKFPEPIFTPAIKAQDGHDENISIEKMKELIAPELADKLVEKSIALYKFASGFAAERGMIIADTKFEFGILNGELILIDEIFTPDSSRFWLMDEYAPGKDMQGFDKQPLRDWLQVLTDAGKWNKTPPGPELPDDVVQKMSNLYRKAFQLITGSELK